MGTTGNTTTEERALTLLGSGVRPDVVALSLGVSPSRITQLMSDPEFMERVTELRFNNLQKHNARDNEYDALEDQALAQLKNNMAFIQRPMELLKTLSVLNAAKRRGQSAPEAITEQQSVVQINMPVKIIQKFTTNINNQVIQAGNQELITIQSGQMEKLANVRSNHAKEIDGGISETRAIENSNGKE